MGLRVSGVHGLGGSGAWGFEGLGVQRFRGSRVQGAEFRGNGSELAFRVEGLGFRG